jgi:1,4-dihydroxy-2-naphthoate octaprenyltransferase
MMKKWKDIELDEHKKQLLIYLSLLAASIFIAIGNPSGIWLPIGLALGIVVNQILYIKKKKEKAKNAVSVADSEKEDSETADQ